MTRCLACTSTVLVVAEPLNPYGSLADVQHGGGKFRLDLELRPHDFEHGGPSVDEHRLAGRLGLHVAGQVAFFEMQLLLPVIGEGERRVPGNRDR